MLSILKKKSPYEQEAKALYAQCLDTVRKPVFYTDYNLPDTMEVRFDLLIAHMFLLMSYHLEKRPNEAEDLNQALFDTMFKDMDQTLREMGIGDMGIPKRMRKMMTGFNGRIYRYSEALDAYYKDKNLEPLHSCTALNIYNSDDINDQTRKLANYLITQHKQLYALDTLPDSNIFA